MWMGVPIVNAVVAGALASGADLADETEGLRLRVLESWHQQDWMEGREFYVALRDAWRRFPPVTRKGANRDPSDFFLLDTDGKRWGLPETEGKIVVLEWTNHQCPTVNRYYREMGLLDTRADLEGDDLIWWTIDSSAHSDQTILDARAWMAEVGHPGTYLLDPDGRIGRAWGATNTPQFFVLDTRGELRYQGAWDDDEGTRFFVSEAVTALRDGREIKTEQAAPRGCTVKYARAPVSAKDEARSKAEVTALVLEALSGELDSGRRTVDSMLADPTLMELHASDAFRGLLRKYAKPGRLEIAAAEEPGDRMVVTGTMRNQQGEPVKGALIYVYQTDSSGWYSRGVGVSAPGPSNVARLFGYLRTNEKGTYEFETVRPGLYPDRGPPAHIHFEVSASGYQTIKTDLMFSDGARMRIPRVREVAESNGFTVADVRRAADGIQHCEFHATLIDRGS